MMIEAARTSASPAAIWTICIVAVACLAFWLGMVSYADRHPYVRDRRLPDMPGPVLGGIHLAEGGRSVAPSRELPADLTLAEQQIPPQRAPQPAQAPATAPGPPAAGEPTAAGAGAPAAAQAPAGAGASSGPIPAQRTASGDATPADTRAEAPTEPIPAQRAQGADAETDHPADSGAGGRA
jgi:hypothetical protein